MAMHGFDIAVGMTPDACSKRAHIFSVAAQYALSQEEIDLVLSDEELDSYLFTFGEAQKAITVFRSVKMLVQIFRKFCPNKDQRPARKSGLCLVWLPARLMRLYYGTSLN